MTDRAQRIALWIIAVLLVVGTSLALRYARGYRPLAGLGGGTPVFPADVGIRFDRITVIGRDKGRPAWTLKAGRVQTTRSRSRVDFSGGIQAALLDKGKPAATLTAPTATYDNFARALRLSGNIVCTVRDLRISTGALNWDAGSNLVRCPGPVRATLRQGEVTGADLTLDLRTRTVTVRNAEANTTVEDLQGFGL